MSTQAYLQNQSSEITRELKKASPQDRPAVYAAACLAALVVLCITWRASK